jgi:hypothetical protein
VSPEDVRAVLVGITPGWYRTADLYPRYAAWAASKGREVASAKTLGEVIRRGLRLERRTVHGHVAAWHVTEDLTSPA